MQITKSEAIERMARAIYYSDPNFSGWGAVPKDKIYWEQETNKEQCRREAEAALVALCDFLPDHVEIFKEDKLCTLRIIANDSQVYQELKNWRKK